MGGVEDGRGVESQRLIRVRFHTQTSEDKRQRRIFERRNAKDCNGYI